jgi:HPt (histidine-containing phosphotransfer) domain-containing protein
MRRLMGNRNLYNKLLQKFFAGNDGETLRTALAGGDAEGAKNAVHTIKGTAGNLSLTALHGAAAALEAALKAGEDPAGLSEKLYETMAGTEAVFQAMQEES